MSSEISYNAIPVAELEVGARSRFIMRTYAHLLGAIALFTGIEAYFFKSGIADSIFNLIAGFGSSYAWLGVLAAFMVVSWIATHLASNTQSKPLQYLGLIGYVVAQAVIFVPLLYIAQARFPGVIESAALVTLVSFAALTAVVFITRKDFSFLRGILMWGFIGALVLILAGTIFGFQLGTYFSVGMIVLAGGAILYDTSNVLHHYPEDRYVGASLQLFASVALLFWYVLRLFMSSRD